MSLVRASKLVGFHEELSDVCGKILDTSVRVLPPHAPSHFSPGLHFAYTLDGRGAIPIYDESDRSMVCFRLRPARQGTGQLEGYEPAAWVSWFERWISIDGSNLKLEVAKWSVYWGSEIQKAKRTILRAEWDQTCFRPNDKGTAGQPHWHVDGTVMIGPGAIQGIEGELVPVDAVPINKVHLGMSGWKHSRLEQEHRPCHRWQMAFSGDPQELLEWSARTLEYLQDQAGYLNQTAI
jgi:hypothetical protein